jgi:phosphate transporter
MSRADGGPQVILLALAISANCGGFLGPIASPQNAVALKALGSDGITYPQWLGAAIPLVIVEIFAAWAILLWIWKPFQDPNYVLPVAAGQEASSGVDEQEMIEQQDELAAALLKRSGVNSFNPDRLMSEKVEKIVVLTTCFVTIVLWCLPMEPLFGDAGVVALLPIVIFFGLGVLNKDDFNGLSWHLLFLLAGGNMLGVCTKESGLLKDVVESIRPFLAGNSSYTVVVVLILFVALVTTFVSHTVAALLLSPVIVQIAAANPDLPSAKTLVFLSVIMCSGSMTFPITSFPNVNSLLAEDEHAQPYLEPKHFLLPGGIMTVLCIIQLISYMLPFSEAMFP